MLGDDGIKCTLLANELPLRSGAKGLRASAVYPLRYGKAVASYHKKYVLVPGTFRESNLIAIP